MRNIRVLFGSLFPNSRERNISVFGCLAATGLFGGFVDSACAGTSAHFVLRRSFPTVVQWNSLVAASI